MSNERIAMAIAAPVALVAAAGVFFLFKPKAEPTPVPSPSTRLQATTPVAMPAPTLDERQSTVCRAFVSQLPEKVRDGDRRAVTAGHEQNAAYGDPAVTVACGVPKVTVAKQTDIVYPLNGVCWYPQSKGDTTVWTTVDREVAVSITMPSAYNGQWVIPFSNTVIATILSTPTKPWGCTNG